MGGLLLSLLFSVIITIIGLYFLYWAIKSAINDSEVVRLLREINMKLSKLSHKLEQQPLKDKRSTFDSGKSESSATDITDQVDGVDSCPACKAIVPLDSKICPRCGIVFLSDDE